MAILAASTTNPTITLQQGGKEIILTRSTLDFAFRLQRAIGSASIHLAIRTYFAAAYIVLGVYLATRVLAFQSYLASRFVTIKTALLLKSVNSRFWKSPKVRKFRKAFELELFLLLVGPANTLILLVFWPGWIVIAAALWGLGLWTR